MKLQARQIESFVQKPGPEIRAVLVYGPDSGLIRARGKTLGLSVVKDLSDPFNVALLSGPGLIADPARLRDEAFAISMMGGDRLIRIEDAGDALTALMKDYLAEPGTHALVVLEAGELGPRSPLRLLFEKSGNAAAVPCYVENERDLAGLARRMLQDEHLSIDQDALAWLSGSLVGDRQQAVAEIDKLVTYMYGENDRVTLEDVQACCGTAGARSLDDLVFAVGSHAPQRALSAYDQLLEEGTPVIAVLRALQNHFTRLHFACARMQAGEEADRVMETLSPPVFYKYKDAFRAQLLGQSPAKLDEKLEMLAALEASCKRTGMPDETLCGQALLALARA